jgi:hypothetical protein
MLKIAVQKKKSTINWDRCVEAGRDMRSLVEEALAADRAT